MIYVSQGHEHGVGLEIYFKSLLCLSKDVCNQFILVAYTDTILKTLNTMNMEFILKDKKILLGQKVIAFVEPDNNFNTYTQSTATLLYCLQNMGNTNILFTLPTSKDQLFFNEKQQNGYTEFLRNYFNNPHLTMAFVSPTLNTALITDHIPVRDLSKTLTSEYIYKKIENAFFTLNKLISLNEILISGINPHAGEGGLIGNEDVVVSTSISKLSQNFKNLTFLGPFPGDTMFFSKKGNKQLLVYMYHDQGLALFKAKNGLIGANITCGLPFVRASVDHGTAFNLFGKNSANYQGCIYTMKLLANALHSKVH